MISFMVLIFRAKAQRRSENLRALAPLREQLREQLKNTTLARNSLHFVVPVVENKSPPA
jgi:hypothetical protein